MHQKQAPAHTGTAGVCCSEHSEPGTEAARPRSIHAGSGASAPARSAPPAHHRRPGQSHAADAGPGGPVRAGGTEKTNQRKGLNSFQEGVENSLES